MQIVERWQLGAAHSLYILEFRLDARTNLNVKRF